jgi:phospholipid/cholesterol/gamma-HCH transport system substrate-binding protein
MNKTSNELKVGVIVLLALSIVLIFARLIGGKGPFQKTVSVYLTYNFAGGIEKGSPVRLAGVKVGKVEDIIFVNPDEAQMATPLKIQISLSEEAARLVRQDSKFYINLAGLIGERYIEITSGTATYAPIKENDVLRGIDPPRIDQLISQSFNLAGEIQKVIEKNEGNLSKSIVLINELSGNLNKTLIQIERSKILKSNIATLLNNLVVVSEDMKEITGKTKKLEVEKHLELVVKLLKRLEEVDKETVQKFLQKEGVRVRIF